jgi:hypothetical protein
MEKKNVNNVDYDYNDNYDDDDGKDDDGGGDDVKYSIKTPKETCILFPIIARY